MFLADWVGMESVYVMFQIWSHFVSASSSLWSIQRVASSLSFLMPMVPCLIVVHTFLHMAMKILHGNEVLFFCYIILYIFTIITVHKPSACNVSFYICSLFTDCWAHLLNAMLFVCVHQAVVPMHWLCSLIAEHTCWAHLLNAMLFVCVHQAVVPMYWLVLWSLYMETGVYCQHVHDCRLSRRSRWNCLYVRSTQEDLSLLHGNADCRS